MKHATLILFCGFLLALTTLTARAQYNYITNNGTITITGYTGSGGSVTIPSTINGLAVTSIGTNAFYKIGGISTVTFPGSVTNIGDYAFFFSYTLVQVNFSPGLISIGNHAFDTCSQMNTITFPSTLTSIGDYAFYSAFYQGINLVLTIPTNVTHIGTEAFGFTGLRSVALPAGVTNLGANPFASCSSLTAITVATNNPAYTNVNGVLFDKNQATLISYPGGLPGSSYVIPNTVTAIGADAFDGSATLSNITIPSSVTSIGDSAFFSCNLTNITIPASVQVIGDSPFGACFRLTEIDVDTNNPVYASSGGVLFDQAQTRLIAYPAASPASSYTVPATVTNIGDYAFSEVGPLGSITIPGSVISIGAGAFLNSGSLSNVSLVYGVTTIGLGAFENCLKLKSVNLPDSILSIGDAAFDFCIALGSITIPGSVTNVGIDMFATCSTLTNVTFGDGLATISEAMFDMCTSLGSVTIPASVTNIGVNAFEFDSKLTAAYFEGGPPVVAQPAFGSLTKIYYLPNASGWGTNYAGRRTAIWQPAILTKDGSFGLRGGQFGFNISWASNYSVTVSANNDLTTTNWTALQSCTLTNGTFYFSDAAPNSGQKFYRLSWP